MESRRLPLQGLIHQTPTGPVNGWKHLVTSAGPLAPAVVLLPDLLYTFRMLPLKAHVQNGHIVVDEPTDLPEGTALMVIVEEEDSLDDMAPEERAQLDRALRASLEDVRAGRVVEGDEIVHRLLARP